MTCQSLSAKARFYYNSIDPDKCYLQWIGKPILRVNIEPIIGNDFNLKSSFPLIKEKIEQFLADQLIAFEKEDIDIPMTETPLYDPRYDGCFEKKATRSIATQAYIGLSAYRKQFIQKNGINDIKSHINSF